MNRSTRLSLIDNFNRRGQSNRRIENCTHFELRICATLMPRIENGKVTMFYSSHLCGTLHHPHEHFMSVVQSRQQVRHVLVEKGVAAVGITEQGLFIHWLDPRWMERASELSICSSGDTYMTSTMIGGGSVSKCR